MSAEAIEALPQSGARQLPRIVAIVDDESGVRAFLAAVVKKMGLQPIEAASADNVVKIVQRDPHALVLLDLSLGRADGVQVLEELAARQFPGAVILISGHDQSILDQVNSIGARLGLNMLRSLKKPFKPDALRLIVREANLLPSEGPLKIDILKALKQDTVELHFQPKLDLRTLTPVGAEVLACVNDPAHGLVSEDRFAELLNQEELNALTQFSLRRAMTDWQKLAAEGIVLRLAVNVPLAALVNNELIEIIRRERPFDPRWPGLIIEVPERSIPTDLTALQDALLRLKLHNTDLAVDDVEMVSDNYLRLRNGRLAELKLHRRFVDGCASNRESMSVCRAVLELAARLKVPAVAQGIETTADQQALERLGYSTGQGKVLAIPSSVDELKRFMRATYQAKAPHRS